MLIPVTQLCYLLLIMLLPVTQVYDALCVLSFGYHKQFVHLLMLIPVQQ